MAFVRYTAKRSVIPGHTAGTDYEIEFDIVRSDRSRRPEKQVQRSLDGSRESLYYGADEYHDAASTLQDESSSDTWREFMDSVEGGEEFQYDPDGTVAVPVNLMSGYVDGVVTEQRTEPNWIRYSFRFLRRVN